MLVNRYRISGLLGRGGMGEVYRADDLRLGQTVALKFLPDRLRHDPVRLAQFHNEARTARQVSHPNVCRVHDIGEVGEQIFLTMEYVDGEDLSSLLRRIGRVPEDKALEIARQICAGLAAAHERGVLHRDLKPANIMLDGSGKVRLMDFGLAAIGDVSDIRAGTPAYMAPEQLQGREVTVRSDIYSLGLVLYELFTGRRTFDAKTLAELVERHEAGLITAPTDLVKTLDPAIESGIMRCLAEDPARRPASALAVSGALPGGDPLAAALAAGETPSPEMVAAAGGEAATMSGARGAGLLAVVVVLLVMLGGLGDRTMLVARVPLDKSRPVLIDRAAELRHRLGYTAPVADAVSGFNLDAGYVAWAARRGAGASHWADLSNGRPSAIRFWYRTSPSFMIPFRQTLGVTSGDPPLLTEGMVRMDLDMGGRLLRFEAVPSSTLPPLAPVVNWAPLFEAAGLDRSRFVSVPPKVLPRGTGDERQAWEGSVPEVPGTSLRIEAVGFEGRPTMFTVQGEWERGGGQAASNVNPIARWIGILLVVGLPITAAGLARRNLQLGRGDRRGAFRTWAFTFASTTLSWVISPYHVAGPQEIDRLFPMLGQILFWTGILYVTYLALEPYVRRTWPTVLITWTRVVSGRMRDPLVGRDLIAGTIGGLLVSVAPLAFVALPRWLGRPEPQLVPTGLATLFGTRELLAYVLEKPLNATSDAMLVMFLLSLIRQGLRTLGGLVKGVAGRVLGSDGLLWAVSIALLVMIIKRNGIDDVYPWLDAGFTALMVAGVFYVAFRFGVFALVVSFLVLELGDIPPTLDGSKPYAGAALLVAAIAIGLALTGVWLARAGQPLFGNATDASRRAQA